VVEIQEGGNHSQRSRSRMYLAQRYLELESGGVKCGQDLEALIQDRRYHHPHLQSNRRRHAFHCLYHAEYDGLTDD
jgi:hypothetical protein